MLRFIVFLAFAVCTVQSLRHHDLNSHGQVSNLDGMVRHHFPQKVVFLPKENKVVYDLRDYYSEYVVKIPSNVFPPTKSVAFGEITDKILSEVSKFDPLQVGIKNLKTTGLHYGGLVSHYVMIAVVGECPCLLPSIKFTCSYNCKPEDAYPVKKEVTARMYENKLQILSIINL